MRIGITVRSQFVNEKESFIVYKRYMTLLKGNEVLLLMPHQSDEVLSLCDSFILTGGDDLNPNLYGQTNLASTDIDNEVDELDMKIIDFAYKNSRPLLGICRGMQSINIYFGGTLHQNYNGHMRVEHYLMQINKPRLFKIANKKVNSYHHQAIDELGEGLIATYTSDDGVIEVVEHKNKLIIGVQYHPEILVGYDDEMLYNVLF